MKDSPISVQTLQKLLNKKEQVVIIDVRPKIEREEWHIPGSIHKDVYELLKKGDQSVFDDLQISKNTPLVTVCAAGKSSKIAAEILNNKGYKAFSLVGGMKAWNYAWNIAEKKLEDSDVKIVQVRRVAKGCLSYIIGSGKEAIVIDASLDPEVYLNIAKDNEWIIKLVMDTHIHADYFSRTRDLAQESGANHIFIEEAKVDFPFNPVSNHQVLTFGNATIKVLHTPGHTWESTSYLINQNALLTGDTLFTDGVGRPDLKADKEEAILKTSLLFNSLQEIQRLPKNTLILPAHVSHAVLFDGKMIMENLYQLKDKLELLNLSKEDFIKSSLSKIPPTPPNYLIITELNKSGNLAGQVPADLEAGANRCAVA